MKILHIISGLKRGGAELMLLRLLRETSLSKSDTHSVISLTTLDGIGVELQSSGINVYAIGIRGIFSLPFRFFDLIQLIKQQKPDLVQTWMYHADFIGGLASRLAGFSVVVWGIRSTAIPQGWNSQTYWLIRLCSFLSRSIPKRIICCAFSARTAHINLGYASELMTVIPNGYQFDLISERPKYRDSTRLSLDFSEDELIIGVIGRFDPLKDYLNFIQAASKVSENIKNVKFLMVGRGNDSSNKILMEWLHKFNIADKFNLIGEQLNVQPYLSAMDIFCLSSEQEAFPNVVVEAMAAGLPCVVTNAGDAANIVENSNYVVPTKDAVALAHKLIDVAKLSEVDRAIVGEHNSEIVRKKYDIKKITSQYEEAYKKVLGI